MNNENLTLSMGALSDTFDDQIKQQGFDVPEDIEQHQKDADAITRLVIRGLIPQSVAHKSRQKLVKAVAKSVDAA